jgi:hypothetical protein
MGRANALPSRDPADANQLVQFIDSMSGRPVMARRKAEAKRD